MREPVVLVDARLGRRGAVLDIGDANTEAFAMHIGDKKPDERFQRCLFGHDEHLRFQRGGRKLWVGERRTLKHQASRDVIMQGMREHAGDLSLHVTGEGRVGIDAQEQRKAVAGEEAGVMNTLQRHLARVAGRTDCELLRVTTTHDRQVQRAHALEQCVLDFRDGGHCGGLDQVAGQRSRHVHPHGVRTRGVQDWIQAAVAKVRGDGAGGGAPAKAHFDLLDGVREGKVGHALILEHG